MLKLFNENYKKILKKIPLQSALSPTKYLIFLGLAIYWAIIIFGTYINL
tara:strand:- start:178 stop:324 length:147 start_codon:yes stop_codon:yes gene_type:complete